MGHQSEAILENKLIKQLVGLGYTKVSIPDGNAKITILPIFPNKYNLLPIFPFNYLFFHTLLKNKA